MMIRAAATRLDGVIYSLEPPARHHNILWHMESEGVKEISRAEQGFIDEHGVFLGREEAATHALESRQVDKLIAPPSLFSEDLW